MATTRKNAVKVDADIAKWLKTAEERFAEDAAQAMEDGDNGYVEIEDGKYEARLTSAEIGKSNAGKIMAIIKFEILEGEYAGKTATKFVNLENEDSLYWFAKDLKRLGVEDPSSVKARDIPGILAELAEEGAVYQIQLKTKGEYQNLFINQKLDDYEGDEDEDDSDDGSEDDEEEEFELNVGDEVTFSEKGKEFTGSVVDIDEDEETCTVKVGRKKYTVAFDALILPEDDEEEDEEEEEEDEESSEFEVGMTVQFTYRRKQVEGEIVEVDEDEEEAIVKVGTKKHTVAFSDLTITEDEELDEEDEEEEEEEPVKKPVRKTRR